MSRADLDLKFAAALALLGALVAITVDSPAARAVPAILLVLVLPGYALSVALFPQPREIFERCLLTVGLSLCVGVLGGLILDRTGVGLTSRSWSIGLAGLTLAACAAARQRRSTEASPPAPAPAVPPGSTVPAPKVERRPTLAAVGLVAVAAAVAAGAVLIARQPSSSAHIRGSSALWIVAVKRSAGSFSVGIRSNELRTTSYRLLAREAAGQRVLIDRRVTLAPGGRWVVDGKLPGPGDAFRQVRVSLYKADRPGIVYRRVYVTFEAGP